MKYLLLFLPTICFSSDFQLEKAVVEKYGDETVAHCQHGRRVIPPGELKAGQEIVMRYRLTHINGGESYILTHAIGAGGAL